MTGSVAYAKEAGVAVVTLDDADRRNVLSASTVDGLVRAFDSLESDDGVRAAVVTGAGRAFCAGAELARLEEGARGDYAGIENVYRGFLRIARSPVVTIAAVNGAAVGAGLNLALACDIRLAARDAFFEAGFSRMQLHPGGGSVWMLEQAVGRQAATMAVLLGERINAETAHRLGLVWSVHEPDALLDAARGLAGRVAGLDPAYVRVVTSTLRSSPALGSHELAVEHERHLQRWSMTRPAFREGIRALRRRIEGGQR